MAHKIKTVVRNREGLTSGEWIAAVGQVPMLDLPKLHKAWEAGEDPTDWKAHYERERAETSYLRSGK